MYQDLQSPALCDYSNLDLYNYILSSECICMQIWKDKLPSANEDSLSGIDSFELIQIVDSIYYTPL